MLGLTGGTGYGETVAEAAYTYAAGDLDSAYARSYGRSFTWTCPSCDGTIHEPGGHTAARRTTRRATLGTAPGWLRR